MKRFAKASARCCVDGGWLTAEIKGVVRSFNQNVTCFPNVMISALFSYEKMIFCQKKGALLRGRRLIQDRFDKDEIEIS